ncbi:MAG: hypothetical protein QXK13_06885 [Fervidicoccaceae archaeon]
MTEVQSNPIGEGGQASPKTIEVSFPFGTYRNTFEYSLLYSLKKKNFIKGNAHKGLSWSVDYKLFPGRYILFETSGYLDNRGAIIAAHLIYLNEEGEIQILETAEAEYVVPGSSDNLALRAFFNALPGYHDKLMIPYLSEPGPDWQQIKASIEKLKDMPSDPEA